MPKRQRLSKRNHDEEDENIPEKFIKHIQTLGFQESDAGVLYRDKDQWNGITREPQLLCPVLGCEFKANVTLNCFDEHCRTIHKWKPAACLIDDCQYVAYNQTTLAKHRTILHSSLNRSYAIKAHQCTWKNCHSSFRHHADLRLHMRLHTNSLRKCSFCPFRSAKTTDIVKHYRQHYGIFDYKCDFCGKLFTNNNSLLEHTKVSHDFEMANCPLCKREGKKHSIQSHILSVHKVLSKWNKLKRKFEVYKR